MKDGHERRAADEPQSPRRVDEPAPKQSGEGASLGAFAGLGLQFAVSIVLFVYLGQWLDRRFGTSPLFLLLGLFVGAGGTFYSMVRRLNAAQKREDEARAAARRQQDQGGGRP